jgi:hypothetical protein
MGKSQNQSTLRVIIYCGEADEVFLFVVLSTTKRKNSHLCALWVSVVK